MSEPTNEKGKLASTALAMRPSYSCWKHMMYRCYNEHDPQYANYGGRGITVCQEWRESSIAFIEYMGPRPSRSHSLERIDVNGNYEPGNVRWATSKEQCRNMRVNRWLELNGERLCLTDWSAKTGLATTTIYARLKKGWSVKDALTKPPMDRRDRFSFRPARLLIGDKP